MSTLLSELQFPTIKQANTTHLADEKTGNLQIIRQRVTWQKIKMEQALRWEMLGVGRKQKGRCKSRKDVASEDPDGSQPT